MVPSPRDDSLFVPSRTAEHARTFVSWPCRPELWDAHLAEAEAEYAAVVEAIARFEPVTVIFQPGTQPRVPTDTVHPLRLAEVPIDDSWVRDNGPIFVVDGRGGVAAVRFGFNAWGEKFAPFADDAELLGEYLGIEKVIWLAGGLVEDRDTDGHSDNVVQFVRPGVVLIQMAPDRSNANWDGLRDNRARLAGETDAAGRKLEVVEMPVLPYVEVDGERYVVPYVNYFPVNGGIVAPQLDEPDNDVAFALLRELFPGREVVGAPSRLLAYGGGGIGCITQQLPAGMALVP
jgi:agmatine deiminase